MRPLIFLQHKGFGDGLRGFGACDVLQNFQTEGYRMAGAAGSDDVAVLDYALTLVDDGDALGGEGRLEFILRLPLALTTSSRGSCDSTRPGAAHIAATVPPSAKCLCIRFISGAHSARLEVPGIPPGNIMMSSLRISSSGYSSRVDSALTLIRCALVTAWVLPMDMMLSSMPPLMRMSAGAMASVISKPSARKINARG